MTARPHIRVLSDSRPGHENQSVGLALALARRIGATHEMVRLDPEAGTWARMKAAAEPSEKAARVDLLIAAGHRTHLPLWWAGRKLGARTVLIMTPSLPLAFFDLVLVPQHDVPDGRDSARRLFTRGALNRVPEELPEKTNSGLVLVGGPSKHHGWDAAGMSAMIERVITAQPELEWTVVDSRRTPAGFLERLKVNANKVPQQATAAGWLADELARARAVWATADSVSMVHEAATAGAATGVLPVPPGPGGDGGRTQRAVDLLIAEGLAMDFAAWERAGGGPLTRAPGVIMHEAGRCADHIAARWFAGATRS